MITMNYKTNLFPLVLVVKFHSHAKRDFTHKRGSFLIPLHMGGLNILNPTEVSELYCNLSKKLTALRAQSILGNEVFEVNAHIDFLLIAQSDALESKTQLG